MAHQAVHSLLAVSRIVRSAASFAGARARCAALLSLAALAGCGAESPPGVTTAPIAVKAGALATCSGAATSLSQVAAVRVLVRHQDDAGARTLTFDTGQVGFSGQGSVPVGDVPIGLNEEVTLLGFAAGSTSPTAFARASGVSVAQGGTTPVALTLSRFGGYSCPSIDNPGDYTHRVLPTVTPLGAGRYLVAGGLTAVQVQGGVTRLMANAGSARAFIYDSNTGKLTKTKNDMNVGRGAHAAALVRGRAGRSRVVLFGGASALTVNANEGSGFAWTFELQTDGLNSIEVFEYDEANPGEGTFKPASGETLRVKRVKASANTLGTDGLVLICGGGLWGGTKLADYIECEVWDDLEQKFIKSGNDMTEFRAGHAVAPIQVGQTTRLLFVGGNTGGPVAEVYTSSTQQRDGSGGVFREFSLDGVKNVFHHTLTRVAPDKFLVLGGVAHENGKFQPPDAQNAWLLTLKFDPKGDVNAIEAAGIPGLGQGRYFHVAGAAGGERLTVVGGFTGNDLATTADVRHFNAEKRQFEVPTGGEEAFVPRGGMGFVLMDNDTILVAGGIGAATDLGAPETGSLEVYTPSNLFPF